MKVNKLWRLSARGPSAVKVQEMNQVSIWLILRDHPATTHPDQLHDKAVQQVQNRLSHGILD
jgi:hypothetical protein